MAKGLKRRKPGTGKPVLIYLYPKQIDFLKAMPNGSALVRELLDAEQARQLEQRLKDEAERIKQNWKMPE